VEVVSNGVDTMFFTPGPKQASGCNLLFTGTMVYWPNIKAVEYFTEAILPSIRRAVPEAILHIVGASPTEEVTNLAGDGVVVHGAVADMRPYFHEAAVVVAPLRHGGGTRLKILEAAASGKAIVSTPLGAEGLDFRHDQDLVIAETAEDFADAVIGLLRDEARRRRLERNAREASLPYDWQRIGTHFRCLIENIIELGRIAP
jgi:glycosyltransferase involved in cell wall biosynthesis